MANVIRRLSRFAVSTMIVGKDDKTIFSQSFSQSFITSGVFGQTVSNVNNGFADSNIRLPAINKQLRAIVSGKSEMVFLHRSLNFSRKNPMAIRYCPK